MAKSKESLLAEIDANITANGNAEITGPVLNTVLKSVTGNITGGFFVFPKDVSLGESDLGKIVMNDGSGTAKVYQLSAAVAEQLGRWVLVLSDIGDLNDKSMVKINSENYSSHFDRITWRNGNTPTTALDELTLIKDYIDADTNLSFLTTTFVDDELVIEENTYSATEIKLTDFSEESYIDTTSRPALPAAPTAFPLGKLIGIDGDNALISSNAVESYALEGSLTVDNSLFNSNTDIDLVDILDLIPGFASHIIVPTDNGKAKALDVNDFDFSESFLRTVRHQFLGLAIASTSNTVTVSTNYFSFIFNLFVKIKTKDIND